MGLDVTKLIFGVVDVPYVDRESPAKQKARISRNTRHPRRKPEHAASSEKTTGDVATILEDEYHVMEAYFDNHEVEIMGYLVEGLEGALENLFAGGPIELDPFGGATSKIAEGFRDFLTSGEAEHSGIPGTPTAAARRGVNPRLKHPYAKSNPRRPSFIASGLYAATAIVWVE